MVAQQGLLWLPVCQAGILELCQLHAALQTPGEATVAPEKV